MPYINTDETTGRPLKILSELVHSKPAKQRYYAFSCCGHVCHAPSQFEPSAPHARCPHCYAEHLDGLLFEELQITIAIRRALEKEDELARQESLIDIEEYLSQYNLDNCMRNLSGHLCLPPSQQGHEQQHYLSLTPQQHYILKQSKQLIRSLLNSYAITESLITDSKDFQAPEYVPQNTVQRIYQQLIRFHKANGAPTSAKTMKERVLFHRAMIAKLRNISETTATIYAQCAHEQIRGNNAGLADLQTHCSISMETLKEAVYTDCGHLFEKNYIQQWLNNNDSCPCCRASVQHLVDVPLRTRISHALATPNNIPALKAAIAKQHINWPHVVGEALRYNEFDYQCVWKKTANTTLAMDNIHRALNNDVESISHFIKSQEAKPTPASRCKASLFNNLPMAKVVSLSSRPSAL